LKNKDLVRGAVVAVTILAACGKKPSGPPTPVPTRPFPAAGLAGQHVSLVPVPLVAADEALDVAGPLEMVGENRRERHLDRALVLSRADDDGGEKAVSCFRLSL